MDMSEMLARASSRSEDENFEAISASDLPKGFDPIPDLKRGDKVRCKGQEYKASSFPRLGQVIVVNRLEPFNMPQGDGSHYDELDFSALCAIEDGTILEYLSTPAASSESRTESKRGPAGSCRASKEP